MTQIESIHKAYLSLGSNVGNKLYNLSQAIENLNSANIVVDQFSFEKQSRKMISSVYETQHWSEGPVKTNDPNYFNIVCKVHTSLEPHLLLKAIKSIEKKIGRNLKSPRNTPREIDIDVLFFDDIVVKDDLLEIPHPRIKSRAFVLLPFTEIEPNFIHPIDKISIKELLGKLSTEEIKSVKKVNDHLL